MDVQEFINSERGKYLLSQALCVAVDVLKKVPKPQKEPSNIADMEYMIENAFPLYRALQEAEEKFKKEDL